MNQITILSDTPHPGAPLEFYPAPSTVQTQRVICAGTAGGAALLLWASTLNPLFSDWLYRIWTPALIVLAITSAAASLLCFRAAQRMAGARDKSEPVLVLDDFGITLRDELLWRRWRFAWSRIETIGAVPDDKGVSIIFSGDLRPYGSLADIATDTRDDAGTINARLARFEGRLRRTATSTLH
jgi:hypothetical protein